MACLEKKAKENLIKRSEENKINEIESCLLDMELHNNAIKNLQDKILQIESSVGYYESRRGYTVTRD